RWAEALSAAPRASKAEIQELLKQSHSDFRQVFDQSSNAVEKAEAYFWQARGHGLLGNSAKAKEFFGKACDHARAGKSRVWEELAVYEWASLCYCEAKALYPKGAGLEAAIKEAEQQCDELAKLSPTKAAVLQVNLVRMAIGLGRAQPDGVVAVF